MRSSQLLLGPLCSGDGAAVCFTESDDKAGEDQKTEHPRNLDFGILKAEGIVWRQEPVPDAGQSQQAGNNGRTKSAIPCGKDYGGPKRVIRVRFSQERRKHPPKPQSKRGRQNRERIAAHYFISMVTGWNVIGRHPGHLSCRALIDGSCKRVAPT